MARFADGRVVVRVGRVEEAQTGDALLIEGDGFEAGHAVGCACCGGRSGAAEALGRLFQQRARGEVPFFRSVLAVATTAEGARAVQDALRADALVAARFRSA